MLVLFVSTNIWTLIWLSNYVFPGIGIEINGILIVNFLICVGLSVEFCLHTIIRFKRAKGDKDTKLKKAINDVVAVVFKGIFVTKLLGLSVLGFSPIPLFVLYYFRVYYIMVLVCGFYGLIVTPILLDVFGDRVEKSKPNSRKKSINEYILQNGSENEEKLIN